MTTKEDPKEMPYVHVIAFSTKIYCHDGMYINLEMRLARNVFKGGRQLKFC